MATEAALKLDGAELRHVQKYQTAVDQENYEGGQPAREAAMAIKAIQKILVSFTTYQK